MNGGRLRLRQRVIKGAVSRQDGRPETTAVSVKVIPSQGQTACDLQVTLRGHVMRSWLMVTAHDTH